MNAELPMTFADAFHLQSYTIPQNRALGHQPGEPFNTLIQNFWMGA